MTARATTSPRPRKKAPPPDYVAELLLQIRADEMPEPDREVRFHPKRRWRLDLGERSLLVAVEIEGATWAGGRHTRGAGFEADCEKYYEAMLLGWLVIRVTGAMVRDGRALAMYRRALAARTNQAA